MCRERESARRDKNFCLLGLNDRQQVKKKHLFQISAKKDLGKMEMNATDMLYEKMACDLAYGDMMASYGPAPISERSGGGAEFVGYDQHHVSFEQGATRHGTRYSDTSPLPTDIASRSPSDLIQRVQYGRADLIKAHSGPDDRAKAQMGFGDVAKSKDGGHFIQQGKEGGQLGQVRKGKEKPLCDICGQVLDCFAIFIVTV